jgi:hypothetical protein
MSAAAAHVGLERAHWMMQTAPAAIISGTELPEAPQIVTPGRRRRLLGWK